MVCLGLIYACSSSEKDSVALAKEQNDNSAIDEKISEFLTEAADARIMDIEQGKLAKEPGTSAEVRRYGELMITDQTKLLHEIKVLAAAKNITLPSTLSNEKADALADLKEKTGEDFDEKFIKMMTVDHKRDVGAFEDAQDCRDKDVKKFAAQYLPVIESHLERIKNLKEENKNDLTKDISKC
jgi:putative membrane protein